MLIGEYSHSVDEKGRIRIPKNFREDLGDTFYITKGFDGCLFVYSEDNWKAFMGKLASNDMKRIEIRKIKRFFTGSAIAVSLDGQGRVTLSPALRDFAGLMKDAIVTGLDDRAEIWSKEAWDTYQDDMGDIDTLADGLEEFNLME